MVAAFTGSGSLSTEIWVRPGEGGMIKAKAWLRDISKCTGKEAKEKKEE